MKSKPTLVILAAGMGSRYGGLKQIDPIGPCEEIVMDYSVYDALQAGFGALVCVIRRDLEDVFRNQVGRRLERHIPVTYVYQEMDDLPVGYKRPQDRVKPWGTGHAVWAARHHVRTSFAVINADDFYGRAAFQTLVGALDNIPHASPDCAMVAFILHNTLSEFGPVSRGVCAVDGGYLNTVAERTRIFRDEKGIACQDGSERMALTGDELVSMNMWGFSSSAFGWIEQSFRRFLDAHIGNPKAEFYIPLAVDELIRTGCGRCRVLHTPDAWFGVTYKEDKPHVQAAVRALIAAGRYPDPLWPRDGSWREK